MGKLFTISMGIACISAAVTFVSIKVAEYMAVMYLMHKLV